MLFTPEETRAQYLRVVTALAAQMGISPGEFKSKYKIMPYVLKMAAYLDPAKSNYSLSPRKGVDTAIPTANLLDQNDFFAMSGMSIRIGRAKWAAGIYSLHGDYPQLTYPDPTYFNGNGTTAGLEYVGLQNLVNGTVTINIGGDNVVEGLAAQELFYNPSKPYAASPLQFPEFGGQAPGNRGIYPITPNFILDAMADNSFVIQLPSTGTKTNIDGNIVSTTVDSGIRNIVYVVCEGFKVKNLSGGGVNCPVKA